MKPILQALLLADHVYQDRRTNKTIVAGIFNSLMVVKPTEPEKAVSQGDETGPTNVAAQIPVSRIEQAGSPYVYINLTDLHGEVQLVLRYVSLRDHKAVFQTNQFPVSSRSPLETVEKVVPFPVLPREPGTYAVELLSGDEPLGVCRVVVTQKEE